VDWIAVCIDIIVVRWMTYEEGILISTTVDASKDGQPDEPLAVGSPQ